MVYILKVPAGKHLMELVAVDWFKDSKRMDHVTRRRGCAAQVSWSNNDIFYYLNFVFLSSSSNCVINFLMNFC